MNTFATVRDIFFSGSHAVTGGQDAANDIAFLIDEGYLAFDAVAITEKREYTQILGVLSRRPHAYDEAAGGGMEHMALKLVASKYLLRSRDRKARFEQPFCGYFPDVLMDDKSLVVECGHTQNPDKMFDYFRFGNIEEFLQIPYPEPDECDIRGYRFVAGADLHEFLEFRDGERRSKIKELLQKRRP